MKSIQWQDKGLQDFFASIRMLSPTQAAELLKFVDANAAKPVRDPLRYQLLNKFAEGDPDAALAYANGLSSGNAKRMAVSSVISTWAQENPSAALNWVQNLPEGQTRTEALSQLAGQWSRDDPEAAITFAIESLPAGQSRDQFLATLPEDAARQKSIRRYMDNLYRDKPAAAAEWAVALTDENQRNVYIEKIANMWRRSDLAGTRAWIVTTPLPADRQQKYLGD